MEKILVKKIDIKRFNVLAGQPRSPVVAYCSEELEWYSDAEETILGIVLRDTTDDGFVAVLLGMDEGGRFRAFDIQTSIPTQKKASERVVGGIKGYAGQGKTASPQGDKTQGLDLFTPIVPPEKQHLYFSNLTNNDFFIPARTVINELMPHFVDIDGNFVEQFQSNGFDARLWELYINTYLNEEQLFIDRNNRSPDFVVKKYGEQVSIEAVVVGRKPENPATAFKTMPKFIHPSTVKEKLKNEMPIKFGSSLFSKLKKEYWKLNHVKGNALVFAIADFHDDQSMLWSSSALIDYLYGIRHKFNYDEQGQFVISVLKIQKHQVENKTIPSGFFFQPETENVSAVLFSSIGTISKFNRLGVQAGFGRENIIMYHVGMRYDPNASLPKRFMYQVTTESKETWAEGLSMFHNPNAKHPVSEFLFPSIAHHYFDDGQIRSHLHEFHPYASQTINMKLAP